MNVAELKKFLDQFADDADVVCVVADGAEHLDELEEGSIMTIEDTGFSGAIRKPVLYVQPS